MPVALYMPLNTTHNTRLLNGTRPCSNNSLLKTTHNNPTNRQQLLTTNHYLNQPTVHQVQGNSNGVARRNQIH